MQSSTEAEIRTDTGPRFFFWGTALLHLTVPFFSVPCLMALPISLYWSGDILKNDIFIHKNVWSFGVPAQVWNYTITSFFYNLAVSENVLVSETCPLTTLLHNSRADLHNNQRHPEFICTWHDQLSWAKIHPLSNICAWWGVHSMCYVGACSLSKAVTHSAPSSATGWTPSWPAWPNLLLAAHWLSRSQGAAQKSSAMIIKGTRHWPSSVSPEWWQNGCIVYYNSSSFWQKPHHRCY